ncbi:MAG: hypothetical protein PWP23_1321 [Candidatus Sumerlaeota bacterium]|nr:hypothetical protein [Candidatus Sumerlaeota bacterium]
MKKRLALLLGTMLAGLASSGPAQDGSALKPTVALYADGDANFAKVSSALLQARHAAKTKSAAPASVALLAEKAKRNGQYQLDVAVTDIEKVSAAAAKAGLDVVSSFDMYGSRSITVRTADLTKIDAIVDMPEVRKIAFEPLATTNVGSVPGQADIALTADLARSTHSVDGTGVRIGVLSDTFNRVGTAGTLTPGPTAGTLTGTDSQTTLDAPANVRVVDIGPDTGSDEGRGMVELIHDVAPGADISWASAFTSYTDFASNILALATDPGFECDIIVDDVSYFVAPMYQDGPIALAYRDAYNLHGVLAFSSAGNNADNAHESAYKDINPDVDDTELPENDLHDFGGGDTHLEILVENGATVTVTLHWNEPYSGSSLGAGPGSESDLDLFLATDTVVPLDVTQWVAYSADFQGVSGSPLGDPVEFLAYQNTTGSAQTLYVVVNHYDGTEPSALHLSIQGATIIDTHLMGARTIWGHPAAPEVMALAAAPWFDIEAPTLFGATANVDPESFTALGGALPFYFDGTGSPIALETRNKPDMTAPDGTNTSFFGQANIFGGSPGIYKGEDDAYPNFFGTSAAAPHAAAVAALIMEARPAATQSEILSALMSTAVDINTGAADGTQAGPDFRTGVGLIDSNAAIAAISVDTTAPTVSLATTAPNPTATSPIPFTADFDEPVIGFDVSDIVVTNGTPGNFAGSGANYTFDVTPTSYGIVTVVIPASVCTDASSNPNDASSQVALRATEKILTVTPSTVNVGAGAGTAAFSISNTGLGTMPWRAEQLQGGSWSSITSGTSGTDSGTINFEFSANTLNVPRVARIRVVAATAENNPTIITITQAAGNNPELSVTPANQDVGAAAGTTSFTVSNLGSGSLNYSTFITSGSTFLSITSGASGVNGGTIDCSFTENPYPTPRTATIRITSDGLGSPQYVTVTQAASGAILSVTPPTRDFSHEAGTTSFDVANIGTGTMDWVVDIPSGSSFLSITSGSSGTNAGTINLAFSVNQNSTPRTAQVRVTAAQGSGSPVIVTVTQEGSPAIFTPTPLDEIRVSAAAGTTSIDIANTGSGTMPWAALVLPGQGDDWCTITSGASGVNSGTVNISYTENTTGVARVANVRLRAGRIPGSPTSVFIVQADDSIPEATISTTSKNPTATALIPVTVAFDQDVIGFEASDVNVVNGTVSNFAGSGADYTFDVVPTDYGLVYIDIPAGVCSDAGFNANLASNQIALRYSDKILTITPTNQDVGEEATTTSFDVSNTGSGTMNWSTEILSGSTWMSIPSGATGTNSGTINVDVTKNLSPMPRIAIIRVRASTAENNPTFITVTQEPNSAELSVTPANQNVAGIAGTTSFNVANIGGGTMGWTVDIPSGSSWLTVTSGASGTNSGTVNLSYDANPMGVARVGEVRVTADQGSATPQIVTVTQAP